MLSPNQKRYLSQLAQRAFNRECALARGRGDDFAEPFQKRADVYNDNPGRRGKKLTAEDVFRHQEVVKASGKLGLRCCGQDDYKAVEAHFLALVGETGKAFNALVKAQTNGRRIVEYKIRQALDALGKNIFYANGLCGRMHKGTSIEDASESQLWSVFKALQYQVNRTKRRQETGDRS